MSESETVFWLWRLVVRSLDVLEEDALCMISCIELRYDTERDPKPLGSEKVAALTRIRKINKSRQL